MNPRDLVAAAGVDLGAPEWPTLNDNPVNVDEFGKDHYSLLMYVEGRTVDHHGVLEHDHLRCSSKRHPLLLNAGSLAYRLGGMNDAANYPTILRRVDGEKRVRENHDDYDCLDDLVRAGWLTVAMPAASDTGFLDVHGRPIRDIDGQVIDPGFYTGLDEWRLAKYAIWSLTDTGRKVCAAVRAHSADQQPISTFDLNSVEGIEAA